MENNNVQNKDDFSNRIMAESPMRTDLKCKDADVQDKEAGDDVPDKEALFESVVSDIMFNMHAKMLIERTLFYRIVLSGNVDVTEFILRKLNTREYRDCMRYVMKKGYQFPQNETPDQNFVDTENNGPKRLRPKAGILGKCVSLVVMLIMQLILTPIFYIVHAIINEINAQRKSNQAYINCIPALFAILSGDSKMVDIFIQHGCELDYQDKNGNNIFHSLFLLSSSKLIETQDIITAYHFAKSIVFDKKHDFCKLVLDIKNNDGLSAFEVLVKYGTPELLQIILEDDGLIKHTMLLTTQSVVDLNLDLYSTWHRTPVYKNRRPFENAIYDNDNCKEKKWLHLDNVVTREPTTSQISKQRQIQMYDVTRYENLTIYNKSLLLNFLVNKFYSDFDEIQLGLMQKLVAIITWIDMKISTAAVFVFFLQLKEICISILLLFLFAQHGGDGNEFPLRQKYEVLDTQNFFSRLDEIMHNEDINDSNFTIEQGDPVQGVPDPDRLDREDPTWNEIPVASDWEIKQFMTEFYITIDNDKFVRRLENGIGRYEVVDLFKTIPSYNESLHADKLYVYICINQHWMWNHACDIDTYEQLDESCEYSSKEEIKNYVLNKSGRSMYGSQLTYTTLNILSWLIMTISIVHLVCDFIERAIITVARMWESTGNFNTVFYICIPGSYIYKQLLILANVAVVLLLVIVFWFNDTNVTFEVENQRLTTRTSLLIVAMGARFMAHIYSFRLIPGVGHFIYATIKMAADLLNFSFAYFGVVVLFALLFHMLIRDDTCPAYKGEHFETIWLSIFETFKMSVGQSNLPGTVSDPIKLAYMVYVIICALLLMNMIIAVMGNTATTVMSKHWKAISWRNEWLKEALAAELSYLLICKPFSCCWHSKARKGIFNKNMTHVNMNGEHRVYIEVFE